MYMINNCAKVHVNFPTWSGYRLMCNPVSVMLNVQRRLILCTTLHRKSAQASNFGSTCDHIFLSSFMRFSQNMLSTSFLSWARKKVKTDWSQIKGVGWNPAWVQKHKIVWPEIACFGIRIQARNYVLHIFSFYFLSFSLLLEQDLPTSPQSTSKFRVLLGRLEKMCSQIGLYTGDTRVVFAILL